MGVDKLEQLQPETVRDYLRHLIDEGHISGSTQNICINAIKFYLEKVKGQYKQLHIHS